MNVRSADVNFLALKDFMGLTPDVGATLVVALDWAGTKPAPAFSDTPRDPKDPKIFDTQSCQRRKSKRRMISSAAPNKMSRMRPTAVISRPNSKLRGAKVNTTS